MTEPVSGVSKTGEIDRRKTARERFWNTAWHVGHVEEEEQDDTVQISDEARQRASGKIRKTILEHLAEDDADAGS
ncbi:MAG: hypothetical protein WBI04_02645 [Trichlorobacter sp.]|jgi:beta-lactamase class D